MKICTKCGKEYSDDNGFCSSCGIPLNSVNGTEITNQIVETTEVAVKPAKWKKVIAIGAILIVVIAVFAIPKLSVSVDDLCAQGDYIKAYDKAKEDEKLEVKAESIAAERSSFSSTNLKDPSSFKLRDVYYQESVNDDGTLSGQLVLYISGTNSYGGNVSSYWLYTWDNEDRCWNYFCSVSELTEEEYKDYDDEEEMLEKLVDNIGRLSIKTTMEDGIKLDKDAIKRINYMFETDILDSVEPVAMD